MISDWTLDLHNSLFFILDIDIYKLTFFFAESLPATSGHSEIYASDRFACSSAICHQRQTAEWCMYSTFTTDLIWVFSEILNSYSMKLQLRISVSLKEIGIMTSMEQPVKKYMI